MLQGGNQIYSSNDWEWAVPNVRVGSTWKRAVPYVYTNNTWQKMGAGGTNMVFYLTSNGEYFVYSSTNNILVREK